LQLKGARFDTFEEIQKAVTEQLHKIPTEDFSNAMKKLETHTNLSITSNGSYFEKINNSPPPSPGTFGPHHVFAGLGH